MEPTEGSHSEHQEIDARPRTVGFFLDEDPISVCEVVARFTGSSWSVTGSCSNALRNKRRCKHTAEVVQIYGATGGHFLVEMEPSVTAEDLAEARQSPELYRDLILHRGIVQVV